MVLRICEIARSTYYYRLNSNDNISARKGGRPIPGYSFTKDGNKVADARIKGYLKKLISGEGESYGYRKLTQLLRIRYTLKINKKKVYRLCKELQILLPQREKKQHLPRKLANNRKVTGVNQLWQLDIKYGYVAGKQRHFYMANLIDVYDRSLVGQHIGKSCDAADVVRMVQKAVLQQGIHNQGQPVVIRTDNGPQFVSKKFYELMELPIVEHERIPNRTPNKNAYVEAFHSILERECLRKHVFGTFEEAFQTVQTFRKFYNEKRLHGSLGDISPYEYRELIRNGEAPVQEIAL